MMHGLGGVFAMPMVKQANCVSVYAMAKLSSGFVYNSALWHMLGNYSIHPVILLAVIQH